MTGDLLSLNAEIVSRLNIHTLEFRVEVPVRMGHNKVFKKYFKLRILEAETWAVDFKGAPH